MNDMQQALLEAVEERDGEPPAVQFPKSLQEVPLDVWVLEESEILPSGAVVVWQKTIYAPTEHNNDFVRVRVRLAVRRSR